MNCSTKCNHRPVHEIENRLYPYYDDGLYQNMYIELKEEIWRWTLISLIRWLLQRMINKLFLQISSTFVLVLYRHRLALNYWKNILVRFMHKKGMIRMLYFLKRRWQEINNSEVFGVSINGRHVYNRIEKGIYCLICGYRSVRFMAIIK